MSKENEKTLEIYQKVAKNYLKSNKIVEQKYKDQIKKERKKLEDFIKKTFKSIPQNSKVLEIGSADGKIASYIKELGYNITTSDVADDFLKEIKHNGFEPIKFNLLKDKFKGKYSVIFCWRVFVHFTEKDSLKALKRSYNALENNGIMIISLIDKKCKKANQEWIDFPAEYHLGMERYFNYYSKEEFEEIINKTNFKIDKCYNKKAENGIKWLIYVLKKEI